MTDMQLVRGIALACILAGAAALLWPETLREAARELSHAIHISAAEQPVKVLFAGDIMLDRTVATHARTVGDDVLFGGVHDLFANYDLLVGNLEGTITDFPSISQASSSILRFTFDPKYATLLHKVGFDAVSLANNHSLDFGAEGYKQTVAYLDAAGVGRFGTALNNTDLSTVLAVRGKNICLVGYHQFFSPDPASVLAEIARLRPSCDFLAVMPHWGEEYELLPTTKQTNLAHQFIDAGADAVIGSHPHVIEPLEIYNNKAIFYSLGNFIFDQGWKPEVRRGLAVGVEMGDTSVRYTLTATNTFREASVADATTTKAVLADITASVLPADMADEIRAAGQFELKK
jgi:poly-gamma-glutamate synthesis protein (capsule biosynthesis protein)